MRYAFPGLLLMVAISQAQSLYNNADRYGLTQEGLRTGPRLEGGDYSEVQPGNASAGASFRRTTYWLADDFQVAASRWRVRRVTVWGFQDNLHYPSVNQGFVEIRRNKYDGPTIATGRFARSEMTDIYRIFNNQPTDMFHCQKITYELDTFLSPGEYWVVFAGLGVVNVNGPWSPFITKVGVHTLPGANAMGRVSGQTIYWVELVDPGQWPWVPVDLPFWIDGEKLPITAPGTRVDSPFPTPDPLASLLERDKPQ